MAAVISCISVALLLQVAQPVVAFGEGVSMIQRAAIKRRGPKAAPPKDEAGLMEPIRVETSADDIATCKSFIINDGTTAPCSGKATFHDLAANTTESGDERLGADELAAIREESMSEMEGVSFMQTSATVERVGVAGLGKPSEPLAWEPVDADLDIMSLIEEEEGISMVQTSATAIHRPSKEGFSLLQVAAQYKYKQPVDQ
mmetsp:Transcript_56587/g.89687  ORF Transcript_56587/g.89687 Transcript_56587/m.89687 type:complete len:201 (-) Transcript_56587:119-721(-)